MNVQGRVKIIAQLKRRLAWDQGIRKRESKRVVRMGTTEFDLVNNAHVLEADHLLHRPVGRRRLSVCIGTWSCPNLWWQHFPVKRKIPHDQAKYNHRGGDR